MEDDRQMKIWSRVRLPQGNAAENLQPLLAAALGEAAVFAALLRQMPTASHLLLRQLREEKLAHARCIQGIYMLTGGGKLKAGVAPVKLERPEAVLRRSYGRTLQAVRAYEDWAGDPEYGPVFRWMERREREHCAMIAQLMGMLAS